MCTYERLGDYAITSNNFHYHFHIYVHIISFHIYVCAHMRDLATSPSLQITLITIFIFMCMYDHIWHLMLKIIFDIWFLWFWTWFLWYLTSWQVITTVLLVIVAVFILCHRFWSWKKAFHYYSLHSTLFIIREAVKELVFLSDPSPIIGYACH